MTGPEIVNRIVHKFGVRPRPLGFAVHELSKEKFPELFQDGVRPDPYEIVELLWACEPCREELITLAIKHQNGPSWTKYLEGKRANG